METGAAAIIWLEIDLSSMICDDPFAQGQPDACAFEVLSIVQPLEDEEDPIGEPGIDANALIGKDDLAIWQPVVELRMLFQFVRGQRSRRDIDHRWQAGL